MRMLAQLMGTASVALSVGLAQAQQIVIGQSAPLTGPAAAAGTAFVSGARLYIDRVNRAGGVNGRRVELRTLDDAYVPERAAENAKTLIDEGAIALFGFVNTPASVAGAKVAVERKVPFIAPATGVSSLRSPSNEVIFNVRASFKEETARIVSHLQTIGIQRISFFSLLIPESQVMFDHMSGLLMSNGRQFFTVVNLKTPKDDLAQAARDLKPKETQAVVMFCPGRMCADLITAVRKEGASPGFYTISSAGDVFGDLAAQGVSVAVTQVMPYPWVPGTFTVVKDYQQAMKEAGDDRIGYWSLKGYISAQVLIEGLRRTKGTPRAASLLASMQSLGTLNLGGYEVTINKDNKDGSRYTAITLARSGGKYAR